MKPVLTRDLTNAVPVDGRGHGRTPAVQLLIDERDRLLVEAAQHYPGTSQREAARLIHIALSRYRAGRWRRDRGEATYPVQRRDRLTAVLWLILKTRDVLVSERTIRLVLSRR